MKIESKALRDYIRLRHVRDASRSPGNMPAAEKRINGPQLLAAKPIIDKIGDLALRQKVESYFLIFPVINVLEMITDPARDEFTRDRAVFEELAIAIVGPEYKQETEITEPKY